MCPSATETLQICCPAMTGALIMCAHEPTWTGQGLHGLTPEVVPLTDSACICPNRGQCRGVGVNNAVRHLANTAPIHIC